MVKPSIKINYVPAIMLFCEILVLLYIYTLFKFKKKKNDDAIKNTMRFKFVPKANPIWH